MDAELLEVRPDSDQDRHRLDAAVERVGRFLPAGERVAVMITTLQRGVTPAQAATLLGVSRQFVDRLISTGKLEANRLPSSSHRRVPLEALMQFKLDRDRRHAGLATAVRALDEVDTDDE